MTIRVYIQVDEQYRADACRCLSAVRQIRGSGWVASEAWVWFPGRAVPADALQLPTDGQLGGVHIGIESASPEVRRRRPDENCRQRHPGSR